MTHIMHEHVNLDVVGFLGSSITTSDQTKPTNQEQKFLGFSKWSNKTNVPLSSKLMTMIIIKWVVILHAMPCAISVNYGLHFQACTFLSRPTYCTMIWFIITDSPLSHSTLLVFLLFQKKETLKPQWSWQFSK